MISSTPTMISSPIIKNMEGKDNEKNKYTPIPHFPACLGGEWKNLVKTPYLKTTMRFSAGKSLPPHHFPSMAHITVLSGSIQIDDLQSNQAYILQANHDCMIPALLVHEIQFLEDVEFEFELNSNDMIIYWDLEER
ncbi:uncharacterized protein BX663DRAFT_519291 [Cokeromyces recurvatus]|uniref:uncharacterized protein n=1 Tax=Cokeromyces recurvatus TaxID=90255 RepID=UPI00221EF986|nr:uncharacterized protein BX663DRAFT_519291 [Cokeromyces recurvatus]KAI7900007.1 hypothetical protein BX663DRAFT_519291 [Cokeromyces recurvatus]